MSGRQGIVVWLVAVSCAGTSDSPSPARENDTFMGSLSPIPKEGGEIVCEVNAAKIYAVDVERQASARGISTRDALSELIDFELLAQEAERRGYAQAAEVREINKTERTRRLIETVFQPSFDGPEDIPFADVERTWKRIEVRSKWDHEEYHNVSFVRVNAAEKTPADQESRARSVATEIAEKTRAATPSTKEEFRRLALAIGTAHGVELAYDDFSTTRHGRSVEEFAAAAFSLRQHGDISVPTRTKWGWDVLYLDSILPAVHLSLPQVAGEIRQKLFESARRLAFLAWADRLAQTSRIRRNDTWLSRIPVLSPLGAP